MKLDIDKLDEIVKIRILIIIGCTILGGLVFLAPYLETSSYGLFYGAAIVGIFWLFVIIIYGLIRKKE